MNNSKLFENVPDVFLFSGVLDDNSDYYFRNVSSLTLFKPSIVFKELQPEEKFSE